MSIILIDADDDLGGPPGAIDLPGAHYVGNVYVQMIFATDGDIDVDTGFGAVDFNNWLNPKTGMTGYQLRGTLIGGQLPDGSALNTWLNVGVSSVGWSLTTVYLSGVDKTSIIRVEAREKATGTIVGSGDYQITAISLA